MSVRETRLVELVDHAGVPIGESTVHLAHRPPGLLHRAFSVLILDTDGRLLLQRRAAVKTRFALRWANACCGHPLPGQPVGEAAVQRLTDELGVGSVPLTEIGLYVYRAEDPASNRVEHEYDHVLLGRVDPGWPVAFNRQEVDAVEWVEPDRLASDLARDPRSYAPWLAGVLETWHASRPGERGPGWHPDMLPPGVSRPATLRREREPSELPAAVAAARACEPRSAN